MNDPHFPVLNPEAREAAAGSIMDTRKALGDLTRSLRRLHHALVQVVRRDYEKSWGAVDAGQLLQLLTRHPDFAWLHALSETMVDIDELHDLEKLTARDARTAFEAVDKLLTPGEGTTSDFSFRYFAALQIEPAVVIAHVDVRRALEAL